MLPLKQSLLARIAGDGPIPFEEFQSVALYDPEHGFFSKGELRSTKAGDFLTSPEVSPLFGETLARFVEEERARIGPPVGGKGPAAEQRVGGPVGGSRDWDQSPFHLVEVGAGSGSLLKPLLGGLSFEPAVWVVEASPMARAAVSSLEPPYPRLSGAAVPSPQGGDRLPLDGGSDEKWVGPPAEGKGPAAEPRVGGLPRVLASIDELPDSLTGVILANELIDNLPVAIAVRTEDGWRERWVGADGDDLFLVDAPARDEVVEWCDRFAGPCPVDGYIEVQLAAAEWLETALGKLDSGALVLIDYGDTAENLEPRRTEGTLRTYRAHHLGPHPSTNRGRPTSQRM